MILRKIYMTDQPEITPIADPLAEGIVVGVEPAPVPNKEEAPKE